MSVTSPPSEPSVIEEDDTLQSRVTVAGLVWAFRAICFAAGVAAMTVEGVVLVAIAAVSTLALPTVALPTELPRSPDLLRNTGNAALLTIVLSIVLRSVQLSGAGNFGVVQWTGASAAHWLGDVCVALVTVIMILATNANNGAVWKQRMRVSQPWISSTVLQLIAGIAMMMSAAMDPSAPAAVCGLSLSGLLLRWAFGADTFMPRKYARLIGYYTAIWMVFKFAATVIPDADNQVLPRLGAYPLFRSSTPSTMYVSVLGDLILVATTIAIVQLSAPHLVHARSALSRSLTDVNETSGTGLSHEGDTQPLYHAERQFLLFNMLPADMETIIESTLAGPIGILVACIITILWCVTLPSVLMLPLLLWVLWTACKHSSAASYGGRSKAFSLVIFGLWLLLALNLAANAYAAAVHVDEYAALLESIHPEIYVDYAAIWRLLGLVPYGLPWLWLFCQFFALAILSAIHRARSLPVVRSELTPGAVDAFHPLVSRTGLFISDVLTFVVSHAYLMALVVLYVLGLSHVDAIHSVYMLFFVVTLVNPKSQQTLCRLLVYYCAIVICTLYVWQCVLVMLGTPGATFALNTVGLPLAPTNSLWTISFASNCAILLFSTLELPRIETAETEDSQARYTQLLERNPWLVWLIRTSVWLQTRLGVWACYVVFFLVALQPDVAVRRLVALGGALMCLFTHLSVGVVAGSWGKSCAPVGRAMRVYAVVMSAILVARYLYQFPFMQTVVDKVYAFSQWVPVTELGLVDYGVHNPLMFAHLLDDAVVIVLAVLQSRAMFASVVLSREDGYEQMPDAEHSLHRSGSVVIDESDSLADAVGLTTSPPMLQFVLSEVVFWGAYFLYFSANMLVVAVVLLVSALQPSVANGFMVLLSIGCLLSLSRHEQSRPLRWLWWLFLILSGAKLMLTYIVQFSLFRGSCWYCTGSDTARWWGLTRADTSGDFSLASILSVMAPSLWIVAASIVLRASDDLKQYVTDQLSGRASHEGRVGSLRMASQKLPALTGPDGVFGVEFELWMSKHAGVFFQELSLLGLLLAALAHFDVFSVVQIAVISLAVLLPSATVRRFWLGLVFYSLSVLIIRFVMGLNVPPFARQEAYQHWPWSDSFEWRYFFLGSSANNQAIGFDCAAAVMVCITGHRLLWEQRHEYKSLRPPVVNETALKSFRNGTAWDRCLFLAFEYLVKIFLITLCALQAGQDEQTVISGGYFAISLYFLCSSSFLLRHRNRGFMVLRVYNLVVLMAQACFQVPAVPQGAQDYSWQLVVGLTKFGGFGIPTDSPSPFSPTHGLGTSIFVFVFGSMLSYIYKSHRFSLIVFHYEQEALAADRRRIEHDRHRRARQQHANIRQEEDRRNALAKLHRIVEMVTRWEVVLSGVPDRRLWPPPPPTKVTGQAVSSRKIRVSWTPAPGFDPRVFDLPALQQALDQAVNAEGHDSAAEYDALLALASAYCASDNFEAAYPLLQRALGFSQVKHGSSSVETALLLRELAFCAKQLRLGAGDDYEKASKDVFEQLAASNLLPPQSQLNESILSRHSNIRGLRYKVMCQPLGMAVRGPIFGMFDTVAIVAGNCTSTVVEGLLPETAYEFKVVACNEAGMGVQSLVSPRVTTEADPPETDDDGAAAGVSESKAGPEAAVGDEIPAAGERSKPAVDVEPPAAGAETTSPLSSPLPTVALRTKSTRQKLADRLFALMDKAMFPDVNPQVDIDAMSRTMAALTLLQWTLRVIQSRTIAVVVLVCILNHWHYASATSMVFPLALFFHGLVAYPRPRSRFWKGLLYYALLLMVVKFMFQLPMFCQNFSKSTHQWTYALQPHCVAPGPLDSDLAAQYVQPIYLIGVYKVEDRYGGSGFFSGAMWDLFVVVALLLHRYVLQSRGLWLRKVGGGAEIGAGAATTASMGHRLRKLCIAPWVGWVRRIVRRRRRPGFDFHFYTVCTLLVIMLFVMFGSAAFSEGAGSLSEELQYNQFSGAMVLGVLAVIGVLIVDRVAYLFSSSALKLALHIVTLLFVHCYLFFYLPLESDVLFSSSAALSWFYALWCVYFVLGSCQLFSGFPNTPPVESLTHNGYDPPVSTIFLIFTVIPFLPELKRILDWVCATTSLDVFMWLKYEEMFSALYLARCLESYKARDSEVLTGRLPQQKIWKFLCGVLIFVGLLLVLLGPALLFSTVNPILSLNPVNGVTTQFSISGLHCGVQDACPGGEYVLYSSEQYQSMTNVSQQTYDLMTSQFNVLLPSSGYSQTQSLLTLPYPTSVWSLSPPAQRDFVALLQACASPATAVLNFEFRRKSPPGFQTVEISVSAVLSLDLCAAFLQSVNGTDAAGSQPGAVGAPIAIPAFIPRVLRLPAAAVPIPVGSNRTTLLLQLHRGISQTGAMRLWWTMSMPSTAGLQIYLVSDKVAPDILTSSLGSYSVLAVYVTVVLAVGRLVRSGLGSPPYRIFIDDIASPADLLDLCEGVRLAQSSKYPGHLRDEVYLFEVLVTLFRSPDILAAVTKPKLE